MHWTTNARSPTVAQVVVTTRSPIRSSVGLKALMAVTGILLVLFLIAHMLGNLKVFAGQAVVRPLRRVAARRSASPLLPGAWYLWIQRAVLTVAVLAHIWAATVLALRARAARPVRYAHRKPVQGSYAARTMRWGGVIILLFVIYHLLDLTTGTRQPGRRPEHPVRERGRGLRPRPLVRDPLLHPGDRRPRLPPAARRLQRAAQPRPAAAAGRAAGPGSIALVVAVGLCAGYLVVPFAVLTGLVG